VSNNTFAGDITLYISKDEIICVGYPEKYKTYPKNNFINGKSIVSVRNRGDVIVHHWKCISFKDVAFFGAELKVNYFTPYLVRSVSLGNYGRGEITFSVYFSLKFEKNFNYGRGEITFSVYFSLKFEKNFSKIKIRYGKSEEILECINNSVSTSGLNLPVAGNPFVYPYDVYVGNITIFAKENGTWKNIICRNKTSIRGDKEWTLKFAGEGNITTMTFVRNPRQKAYPIILLLIGFTTLIFSSIDIVSGNFNSKHKSKHKGWLSNMSKYLIPTYIFGIILGDILGMYLYGYFWLHEHKNGNARKN